MKTYLIRGVPRSMQRDGWWLSPPRAESDERPTQAPGRRWHLIVLLALIALADALFWNAVPALSLALFSMLCVLGALVLLPRHPAPRVIVLALGVTALSVLPIVELVQPLSIAFLMVGLPVAVAILGARPRNVWLKAVTRFWYAARIQSVWDIRGFSQNIQAGPDKSTLRDGFRVWALPLGVGCVFAALLVSANPVFETLFSTWDPRFPAVSRLLLWFGLAILVWPVLNATSFAPVLAPDARPAQFGPRKMSRMVNAASILRSLVLFNLLFGVQNALDMAYLAGGISLPEGMSYAEYAHLGAYPLLVLALLSGAFALLARPFITLSPWLKALLLIWVAQTIWLTCSSYLRLDLYVQTYGLTRLRIAAGIWMALVASGLGLILWQIGKGYSNVWLLARVAALGGVVLYACCFVSFDRSIARYNLSHDVPLDVAYLCQLGEAAVPVIDAYAPRLRITKCGAQWSRPTVSYPKDWREWGFRNARVRRSLAQTTAQISFQ